MTDDIEVQIRREFIAEATEMLETVESAFIELERRPDDVRVIDRIFRLAHTIKGSALSVGFTRLGEFAHVVETLLVRVREKQVTMTPEISDLLLRSNDRLAHFVAALGRDPAGEVETKDLEDMIQEVLSRGAGAPTTEVKAAAAAPAFGFFDDEPLVPSITLPPKHAPNVMALAAQLEASGLEAYVELARLAAGDPPGRVALLAVAARLEQVLEECAQVQKILKEAV